METSDEILRSLFARRFGCRPETVAPLPGSGSGRRYFRLTGHAADVAGRDLSDIASSSCTDRTSILSCIGVVGENVAENGAFVYLAGHFRSRGINVPEVYAVSQDGRCYIQQDLGSLSLFDAVSAGRSRAQEEFRSRMEAGGPGREPVGQSGTSSGVKETEIYTPEDEDLLCRTIAKLPQIQFEGAAGLDFSRCFPVPAMSARSIMFDLNYFKYCYLLPAGIEYDEARLQDEFEALAADLLAEPYDTFMYRDFQARNVMLLDGEPWFIDFQGGRRGPIYYDVASFVWQASSCFPTPLRQKMIDAYLDALQQYRPTGREEFMARLRLFLLFRIMQVLGAYGFRGLYQRKAHFIESIPFALANLRELFIDPFPAYPYLSELLRELSRQGCTASLAFRHDRNSAIQSGAVVGQSKCVSGQWKEVAEQPVRLTVKVTSFSYRAGIPQDDSGNGGGYVFDCRGMNNPGRYERYRHSTGRDADVIDFLETDGGVFAFLDGVYAMVDPHVETFIRRGFTSLCVNFGCTGGQHRSVYCAEALARHIAEKFPSADVLLTHTRLGFERKIAHRQDASNEKHVEREQ